MKETNPSKGDKIVLRLQISLVVFFYIFASGVFIFLWYAVYKSVVGNDHPVHAVVLASVITFAFLILTLVMTMVFSVIIREGQRKITGNGGGAANESKN
jgi:RsiW-degrading membrane proteinase PrsW (M82 family)